MRWWVGKERWVWLARERTSEGSERSSRRAERGLCAAHSRSGAPCFTFILTTNMIAYQPISCQPILPSEFGCLWVTPADRGPAMCASPLLSRKTPVSPKLQLSVGRFSTMVMSLWVQVTSAAWADQAGVSVREQNAMSGWHANAPPRAVSEAPAERRRGFARLTPGAERRASPRQQTRSCQPASPQNSAGCGHFC